MKRVFDSVAAALGILLFSPLWVVAALAIVTEDGFPILYRGRRVGRFGRDFTMLKFRSMVNDADRIGGSSTPADDPRLTKTGRWMRRLKLDEIPQLVNVLVGDMSIVGPRPQVRWAVDLYSDEEKKLLELRPGITDYASIKFRDEQAILKGSADPDRDYLEKIAPTKLALCREYFRRQSLWTDLRIIGMTLWAISGGNTDRFIDGVLRRPAQHL